MKFSKISVEKFQVHLTGTCKGDSGGPLVIKDQFSIPSRHIQVGIVQGALQCADEGKDFPGIYVRTDNPDVWNFINYTIQNDRIAGIYYAPEPWHHVRCT